MGNKTEDEKFWDDHIQKQDMEELRKENEALKFTVDRLYKYIHEIELLKESNKELIGALKALYSHSPDLELVECGHFFDAIKRAKSTIHKHEIK
ncbi:MAG: hypothetical protein QOA70_06780 [Nitrososphaeraceae archaeon]|nr:hypothetical protein [Nitrososphaeraceae archaeon]